MTQIDRDGNRILLSLLAEVEVFSTIDKALFQASHPYVWTMQQIGIPYRPAAWFRGPLSGSRRKAISRATMKLAREGLVERITETRRDRVTHLRFRRTGFRQTLKLAHPKINWRQLLESLALIDWGDDLWHELDQYPLAIEVMTLSHL